MDGWSGNEAGSPPSRKGIARRQSWPRRAGGASLRLKMDLMTTYPMPCWMRRAMLGPCPAMPKSESESESESEVISAEPFSGKSRKKRLADPRHTPFRLALAEYWQAKNHASPEMPWQGRDAKALSDFLAASPHLTDSQLRQMLSKPGPVRRSSWGPGVPVDREPDTFFRKRSRCTTSRHRLRASMRVEPKLIATVSSLRSTERWTLAREHAGRVRQAGAEQAAFAHPGNAFC